LNSLISIAIYANLIKNMDKKIKYAKKKQKQKKTKKTKQNEAD